MPDPAMTTTLHAKYEQAEEVCDLRHEQGTVKYSETQGFFFERNVYQKRIGRTWETIDEDDFDAETTALTGKRSGRVEAIATGRYRILDTFLPVSRDQAIRRFLRDWEDHGGMMTVISEALDKAGIDPLEETI